MSTIVEAKGASKFTLNRQTIGALYLMASEGIDDQKPLIGAAAGILQRLAQVEAWKANNHAKGSEYIVSLLMGSSLLDSFVMVPAKIILEDINQAAQDADPQEKKSWIEAGKMIEEMINKGNEFLIIDGQNRLLEAILPFINNEFPISENDQLVFDITDEDGNKTEFNAKGKFFKDFPESVQAHFEGLKVPINLALQGTLQSFCKTLIWKNENVSWDDWQKLITRSWFTSFLKQVRKVADKDTMDPKILKVFNKLGSEKYRHEVNGWDFLAAELLHLIDNGTLAQSMKDFDPYFLGKESISDSQVQKLNKYLREFSAAWGNKAGTITNTEIKNYVLIRILLDRPRLLDNVQANMGIPRWNIIKPIELAKKCKFVFDLLSSSPEKLGQKPNRISTKIKGEIVVNSKNPGSFTDINSKNNTNSIVARVEMFFEVLAGRIKETEHVFKYLLDKNIVCESDTNPMINQAEIYHDNPFSADGDEISLMDYDNTALFDRGHKIPKSKGGSNTDLVLQKVGQNRKLKDSPIPA